MHEAAWLLLPSIEHEDEEVASFPAALPPPGGGGGRTGHRALGRGKDPTCLSSSSRARRALERVARRLCPQGCHHGQQLCPQLAWMRRQCHLLGPQNGVLYTDVSLGTPGPCSSLVPRQNGCKGQGETAPMRSAGTFPKHPQRGSVQNANVDACLGHRGTPAAGNGEPRP